MQRSIRLDDLLAQIAARRVALGLDGPDAEDDLRNPGDLRTPEKREMLRLIDERARSAGLAPLPARY
jgi:hypothetical protein